MPRLIVRQNDTEETFDFQEGDITLGRAPENPIVINDGESSRRHCQVVLDRGQYKAVDLASKNGTKVNGKPIQSQVLRDGDIIQIGKAQIVFQELVDLAAPSPVAPSDAAVQRQDQAKRAAEETRKKRWTVASLITALTGIIVLVGVILAGALSHHHRDYDTAQGHLDDGMALMESGYTQEAIMRFKKIPAMYPKLYKDALNYLATLDPAEAPEKGKEPPLEPEELRQYNDLKNFAKLNEEDPAQYAEILKRAAEFSQAYPHSKFRKPADRLADTFRKRQEETAQKRHALMLQRVTAMVKTHEFSAAIDEIDAFLKLYPNHETLAPEARQKENSLLDEARLYVGDQKERGDQYFRDGKLDEALAQYEDAYYNLGKGRGRYKLFAPLATDLNKMIETVYEAKTKQ